MKVAVFVALFAAASAGGLTGYSTGNYVQHAHVAQPVAVAHAAPVAYAHAAPVAYAPAPVAYAAAPVVAKTVVPAAQSTAFVNR